MAIKIKRRYSASLYWFIFSITVAVILNIIETHRDNNLPYASNEVLLAERIRLLQIYGAETIPLFTVGLVVALLKKSTNWIVINIVTIIVIALYIVFYIDFTYSFDNLQFPP